MAKRTCPACVSPRGAHSCVHLLHVTKVRAFGIWQDESSLVDVGRILRYNARAHTLSQPLLCPVDSN
jgi:hypothetical protein